MIPPCVYSSLIILSVNAVYVVVKSWSFDLHHQFVRLLTLKCEMVLTSNTLRRLRQSSLTWIEWWLITVTIDDNEAHKLLFYCNWPFFMPRPPLVNAMPVKLSILAQQNAISCKICWSVNYPKSNKEQDGATNDIPNQDWLPHSGEIQHNVCSSREQGFFNVTWNPTKN